MARTKLKKRFAGANEVMELFIDAVKLNCCLKHRRFKTVS
jgi:hypothetical protein